MVCVVVGQLWSERVNAVVSVVVGECGSSLGQRSGQCGRGSVWVIARSAQWSV